MPIQGPNLARRFNIFVHGLRAVFDLCGFLGAGLNLTDYIFGLEAVFWIGGYLGVRLDLCDLKLKAAWGLDVFLRDRFDFYDLGPKGTLRADFCSVILVLGNCRLCSCLDAGLCFSVAAEEPESGADSA